MLKPSPSLVTEIEQAVTTVEGWDVAQASALRQQLTTALAVRRPDLTGVALRVTRHLLDNGQELSRTLTAAACRAACGLLGERHPGPTIEVRVPPFAAVQIGFGTGPRHTRGTPPNVVEFTPDAFLRLATGITTWDDARKTASGSHADEARQAFPLL